MMPRVGKRASGQETGSSNKRAATEPSPGTVTTDTNATMHNPQNGLQMQANSTAAESDAATEHVAAGAETITYVHARHRDGI